MRDEPKALVPRGNATWLVGGSAGTLSTTLSAVLPEPWKSWLHYASPWIAAMVAALWPNAWERFQWGRLRRQGMHTLDTLIVELKEFHAQAMSPSVRRDVMERIHRLEAHRLRITATLPFMEVNIQGDTNEVVSPWRTTEIRRVASPPPPGS